MICYEPIKVLVFNGLRSIIVVRTGRNMSTKVKKSVQEVSKGRTGFGKNDMRYWEGKVYKLTFTEGGVRSETKQYSVKIQYRGERRNFPLALSNRSEAARRARDIYESIIARGWEQTLDQYLPQCQKSEDGCTVGEYIKLASKMAGVAPRTAAGYVTSLRMIAASVAKIPAGSSKFDYKQGGRDAWVSKVDAISLDVLTPSAIEDWKHRFLKARKGNPIEERKGRNSINSFIRQARSLFAPKIVKVVGEQCRLPEILPFKEVSLFPRTPMRYVSRIDIREIVAAAYQELGAPRGEDEKPAAYTSRIEQFKIFLLGAFAGLRRNEIDKLQWDQVDLEKGLIEIRETAHFKPKSEESHGVIEIESEVAALLSKFRKESKGPFVVSASGRITKSKSAQWYRAALHFDKLLAWLRKQGVDDLKPLHVLRKEAGSLVNGAMGIYAASRFLRHGDVRVTAEHYLDKKSTATVGMGSLLRRDPQSIG